jgi:PIN domain nuclease of toxin-antitoxin system
MRLAQLLLLPDHHRDPFDRMLICQALQHDPTIVTADAIFRRYPVRVLTPA